MVIQVTNLTKTFRVPKREEGLLPAIKSIFKRDFETKHAVKNISFAIEEGEIIGLLGPNGAGKSTTIKMLTGILKPSSGEVRALGKDPFSERKEYVKDVGAVFGQKSQLWWDIPALDSFGLAEKLYDIPREEFVARRDELIKRLGIQEEARKPVRNLSLGERMKCEFVMAFLHRPRIVFLDEPTIGLDMFAKESIRSFIQHVNKAYRTTIILTTHDMEDIEHLAQRVIVISGGEKVFDDDLEKLREVAGGERRIRLKTQEPLTKPSHQAITNYNAVSDYEATMRLDTKQLPLNQYITQVTKNNTIQDLEVNRPNVEEIIKEIY